jgi:hypothetical protein
MWRNFSPTVVPLGLAFAVACSSSSNNGGGPADASMPLGDSGVVCNFQPCAPGEICCVPSTTSGQPSCSAATACAGSALTCTSKNSCASGQTCCFAFADGGAVGLGASLFTTHCQTSCASDEYELCTTTADCTNGGFCMMGQYTTYCAVFEGGGFVFPEGGFPPPFPTRDSSAGEDAGGSQDAPADAPAAE